MPRKVIGKKLKGVKRPLRFKELEKVYFLWDAEALYAESVTPNNHERFDRVIRIPIHSNDGAMGRRLLVTGGATVPFVALLEEATGEDFLQALLGHGFTHLYLQCGAAHDQIKARLRGDGRSDGGLQIETFGFCSDLKSRFREHCRGEKGVRPAGVVMGHAGTGTISDAMEVNCALVIVANTTLMDDHQSAFAAEMATEHPTIIQGHLGNLAVSIPDIMDVIRKNGLDDLEPYEEPSLPAEQQLTFIDEVVASATRSQSYYGIHPLNRCIVQ